jgi:hypothetical protein
MSNDGTNIWDVIHDVGLATAGALIGGCFSMILESRKVRTAHSDRERELLKEVGIQFMAVATHYQSRHILYLGRSKKLAADLKAAVPHQTYPSDHDATVEMGKQVMAIMAVAEIAGYPQITKAVKNYMEGQVKLIQVGVEIARSAGSTAEIPQALIEQYEEAEAAQNREIGVVTEELRKAFQSI